jgi:hypothetical protein
MFIYFLYSKIRLLFPFFWKKFAKPLPLLSKSYISSQNSPIKKLLSLQAKLGLETFIWQLKYPKIFFYYYWKIYQQAIFCQEKRGLVSIPSIRHFWYTHIWYIAKFTLGKYHQIPTSKNKKEYSAKNPLVFETIVH